MLSNKLVVNLSRIGKNGTGLSVFSKYLVKFITSSFDGVCVLASDPLTLGSKAQLVTVPSYISITQSVSKIRPLLWFIYATLFFPFKQSRVLSATHHAVPGVQTQIISIHDLRPYFYPDSFLQKVYFRFILPRTVQHLDGILTVSNTTKQLIAKHYSVCPDKIHVVPNCIDLSRFSPRTHFDSTESSYILLVGATWFHKNAHELISHSPVWSNKYRLKILCGFGGYVDGLKMLVKQLQLESRVDFIEYVNESMLISLYQRASVLVYPSLMEGFGIPPLEAMACGIPAIVSDIDVFREVYEDVPIYVQLGQRSSWVSAFKLLENKVVINEKVNRGLEKVKEYSEERMSQSLIEALTCTWPDLEVK